MSNSKPLPCLDSESSLGARYVNMSNALTRAAHGLTLSEKRVVAAAISKIESKQKVPVGNVMKMRVSAKEFAETFDVSMDTAYDQLRSGARKLYERSITFYTAAYKRNGDAIEPTMTTARWISEASYQKGEGWVELEWTPRVLGCLTNIGGQFSSYQLEQASALRSAYSWRLLELLNRFKKEGWAHYSIEDFGVSMDATPVQKKNFAHMRLRVIEPAVKELREKDGWKIEWKTFKRGRKVVAVRFDFERDKQGRLDL